MVQVSVVPARGVRTTCLETTRYRLVPVDALPAIDPSRTVRSLLLSPTMGHRQVSFIRRYFRLLLLFYFAGLLHRLFGMLVPAAWSGGWWIVLSVMFQAPTTIPVTLSLRYEFVLHLAKSFEFWFFAVVNILWVTSMAVCYGDSRALVTIMGWLELENAKAREATLDGRLKYVPMVAVIGAVMLSTSIVGVSVGFIQVRHVAVWHTPRGQVLTVADILVNTTATVVLLLMRLGYQNRNAMRHTDRTVVQCSTCRSRLKFVLAEEVVDVQPTIADVPVANSDVKETQPFVQLEHVPLAATFDASDVLYPPVLRRLLSPSLYYCWRFCIVTAWFCVLGLIFTPTSSVIYTDPWVSLLAPVSITVNVIAIAPLVALHQRQLLYRLFGSFDFLFLVLQLGMTSLSMCHLLAWIPHRCVVSVCVCLWFYAIVTHDALTPLAKARLRWTSTKAAIVTFLLLMIHIGLAYELAAGGGWEVQDRVLLEWTYAGNQVQWYLIPFVFSRLSFVFVWNARLLWRLVACSRRAGSEDELITLRGAVQYRHPINPFR